MLGSNDDIELGTYDGEVIETILVNVEGIILGLDVGT